MSQFLGYRIKSTNIKKLETILLAAKLNLKEAAKSEYHRLLSEEITEIFDDIILGASERPNCPIIDIAVNQLNTRISQAEMTNSGTEYDLRAGVTLIPDKEYTYVMLNASNAMLVKAFEDTKNIEDYKVDSKSLNNGVKTEQAEKWDSLHKQCSKTPAILSAVLTNRMEVDPKYLSFESPVDRAKIRAQRNMINRLLNQYACGTEISNRQLMPLMDKALMRMLDDDIQEELQDMISHLATLLVDIKLDDVQRNPSEPIEPDVSSETTPEENHNSCESVTADGVNA